MKGGILGLLAWVIFISAGTNSWAQVSAEKMGEGGILSVGKIKVEIGSSYIMRITYEDKTFIQKIYYHVIDNKWNDVGSQLNPLSTEPIQIENLSGCVEVTLKGIMGNEENGKYGYYEKITLTSDGKLTVFYEPIETILDKGKMWTLQLGTQLEVATYKDRDISLLVGAKITGDKKEEISGKEITEKFVGLYDDPVMMRFPFGDKYWRVIVKEGIWRVNNFNADWIYEIQFVPKGLDKRTAVAYDFSDFLK